MNKKAIVVFSGGMDSSLCLALAIKEFKKEHVLAISFSYGQRHSNELNQAKKIAQHFKVNHTIIEINALREITSSALLNDKEDIKTVNGVPSTMVVGRNGLMARIAGIHANHLKAQYIYMGVIEVEEANSGYRDCSRAYMDIVQSALRLDFNDPSFEIRTPLVKMTKKQTMELGYKLGVLSFLLENTITCYQGIMGAGCKTCPACVLRNAGIKEFLKTKPTFSLSYSDQL